MSRIVYRIQSIRAYLIHIMKQTCDSFRFPYSLLLKKIIIENLDTEKKQFKFSIK